MPRASVPLVSFNRGRISPLALARIDLERTALSAQTQLNWMPRTLGSMMLRPGLGYIGASRGNAVSKSIPFVFSTTDIARLEVTDSALRVWVADALVTRPTVTAAITNGTFDSDLTGWTDADESGAASTWATGGFMSLVGTLYNAAIRRQTVTVNEVGTVHALRIVVGRGLVRLRVGSSSGADDYIAQTDLRPGAHSLSFTPTTASFVIELAARTQWATLVDVVTVESSGTMELPAPWLEADLPLLRWTQSGDVLFVACEGYQQRRIERRSTTSWSVVLYAPEDGPFRLPNADNLRLTPSALTGQITLTASRALFREGHGGVIVGQDSEPPAPALVYGRLTFGTPTVPLGGTAANINDDNTGTSSQTSAIGDKSAAAVSARIYAKIDFGALYTMDTIEIKGLSINAGSDANHGLYYSTDDSTWVQLGAAISVTSPTPVTTTRTGTFSARYIAAATGAVNYGAVQVTLQDLNGYGYS